MNRLVTSLVATVFLGTVSCDLPARKHQSAWKIQVYDVKHQVLQYREAHGHFPESSDQLWSSQPPDPQSVWPYLHYRLEPDGTFLVWLRIEDLDDFGAKRAPVHNPEILSRGPQPGDVFGRFDSVGELLESSWQ